MFNWSRLRGPTRVNSRRLRITVSLHCSHQLIHRPWAFVVCSAVTACQTSKIHPSIFIWGRGEEAQQHVTLLTSRVNKISFYLSEVIFVLLKFAVVTARGQSLTRLHFGEKHFMCCAWQWAVWFELRLSYTFSNHRLPSLLPLHDPSREKNLLTRKMTG